MGLENFPTNKMFLPKSGGIWGRKILLVERFQQAELRSIMVETLAPTETCLPTTNLRHGFRSSRNRIAHQGI
jgi:hypothetical protein